MQALVEEALRVYRRYAREVVEGLGLCPWAEHARKSGRVVERVLIEGEPQVAPVLGLIDEYAVDEQTEILLVIFPRLDLDRRGFERFVSRVRQADAERHELGAIPFAMAAFHPEAPPQLEDSARLIPFLRRTPDPTIQLVRRGVLERVRERAPDGTGFVNLWDLGPDAAAGERPVPLRQKIADANRQTVLQHGVEEVEALLVAIRRDRDESYRRLLGGAAACPPIEEERELP
jgi:hypothetical protein